MGCRMSEHVILMAVVVTADSREDALNIAGDRLEALHKRALNDDPNHQCWIAEDDRPSEWGDYDSAVFVPDSITQEYASRVLRGIVEDS